MTVEARLGDIAGDVVRDVVAYNVDLLRRELPPLAMTGSIRAG